MYVELGVTLGSIMGALGAVGKHCLQHALILVTYSKVIFIIPLVNMDSHDACLGCDNVHSC